MTSTTPSGVRRMNRRKPGLSVSLRSTSARDDSAMEIMYFARSRNPRISPGDWDTGLLVCRSYSPDRMKFARELTGPSASSAREGSHRPFSGTHPKVLRSAMIQYTRKSPIAYHESCSDSNALFQWDATPCFLCLRCSADQAIDLSSRWILPRYKRFLAVRNNRSLRGWGGHGSD